MLIRYLHLAMSAATVFSHRTPESANSNDMDRQLGDFNWDIQPEDGYPIIGFNNSTEQDEVVFKYNFTGTLSDQKYLDVKLYQNDCVSAADQSLAFINSTSGDELDVDVDIIQETIRKSVHYQDLNGTAAIIGFCLRVDYNYVDNDGDTEVVMFYETQVTINVDLTSNFTLTEIVIDKRLASDDAVEAALDYGVQAYICDEDGTEIMDPEALRRGSALLFCVRKDANSTKDTYVADVLSMTISQPGGQAGATSSITDGYSDPMTDKVCENGICSVKTQLSTKFFDRIIPDTIATIPDEEIVAPVGGDPGNGYPGNGYPSNGCPEELYALPYTGDPDLGEPNAGVNNLTIVIHYDNHPAESGWSVKRVNSRATYMTGMCTGSFNIEDAVVSRTAFVEKEEYVFTITDSAGDGMCCGFGEGSFTIYVNDEMIKTETFSEFEKSVYFVVEDVNPRNRRPEGGGGDRRLEVIPILKVEGVAILSFGRRRLRAPFRGLLTGSDVNAFMAAQQQENGASAQRMLQDGGAQSGFGLLIELRDDLTIDSNSQGGSSEIAVAAIVLIVLAGGCGLGFLFCTRRARKEINK